jgi:hypothetical protein
MGFLHGHQTIAAEALGNPRLPAAVALWGNDRGV